MEETVMVRLGSRIRERRKRSGLTQEEVAKRGGFDRNFWGRLERGIQNPTLTTLARIAAVLDVSISELTEGLDAPLG